MARAFRSLFSMYFGSGHCMLAVDLARPIGINYPRNHLGLGRFRIPDVILVFHSVGRDSAWSFICR